MAETIVTQQKKSRQSHGQSKRRVFTGWFCSFLQTWHVQVMFAGDGAPRGCGMHKLRVAGDRQE